MVLTTVILSWRYAPCRWVSPLPSPWAIFPKDIRFQSFILIVKQFSIIYNPKDNFVSAVIFLFIYFSVLTV